MRRGRGGSPYRGSKFSSRIAEGKVKADDELQPLSSINIILPRLELGKVASCVVLDFAIG